jgi:hypothetical protein
MGRKQTRIHLLQLVRHRDTLRQAIENMGGKIDAGGKLRQRQASVNHPKDSPLGDDEL